MESTSGELLWRTTSDIVTIPQSTPIATWYWDTDADICVADKLIDKSTTGHISRPTNNRHRFLTITTTEDGDDWEWGDDHLHLDLENVPVGDADPPPQADRQELLQKANAITTSLVEMNMTGGTPDECEEAHGLARQLVRVLTRARQQQVEEVEPTEIPQGLNLSTDHLSRQETAE